MFESLGRMIIISEAKINGKNYLIGMLKIELNT